MFINNELSMGTSKYTVGELSTPLAPPLKNFLPINLKNSNLQFEFSPNE